MRSDFDNIFYESLSYPNSPPYGGGNASLYVKSKKNDFKPIMFTERFYRSFVYDTNGLEEFEVFRGNPIMCSKLFNERTPSGRRTPEETKTTLCNWGTGIYLNMLRDLLFKLKYQASGGYSEIDYTELIDVKVYTPFENSILDLANALFFNMGVIGSNTLNRRCAKYIIGRGYIGYENRETMISTGLLEPSNLAHKTYYNSTTPLVVLAIRKDYDIEYHLTALLNKEFDTSNFALYIDSDVVNHKAVNIALNKTILPICINSGIEIKYVDSIIDEFVTIPQLPKTVSPLHIGEYFSKLLINSVVEQPKFVSELELEPEPEVAIPITYYSGTGGISYTSTSDYVIR